MVLALLGWLRSVPLSCALRASILHDAICRGTTACGVSSDSAWCCPRTSILRNEPDWKSTFFMWKHLNGNVLGTESEKFQSGSFGTELKVGAANDGQRSAL